MNPELLILTAPTASGKTSLSIELSKRFPIEIISADSRQVYRLMDIGTAKVTSNEQNIVKHHLIDIINPDEEYSAGQFERDADLLVQKILAEKKIPLIVGGTGFYIKSLIYGLEDDNIEPEKKVEIRMYIDDLIKNDGIEGIKNILKEKDIEAYNLYQGTNLRRLSRALEYFLANNSSITMKNIIKEKKYEAKYFIINHEREILYQNINKRTLEMWSLGFENEVINLLNLGYGLHNTSLNSVGYRECINYLNSNISKELAISEMQKYTRHFAKRQITWNKNQILSTEKFENTANVVFENLCEECEKYLKKIS